MAEPLHELAPIRPSPPCGRRADPAPGRDDAVYGNSSMRFELRRWGPTPSDVSARRRDSSAAAVATMVYDPRSRVALSGSSRSTPRVAAPDVVLAFEGDDDRHVGLVINHKAR